MKIIEYKSYSDITVEFLDDYHYQKKSNYKNFELGKIENRGAPTLYNIGILGTRPTYDSVNNRKTTEYIMWSEMIRRCYNTTGKFPAYEDVSVTPEWFIFDNFYDWFQIQENNNIIKPKIDKDILFKGNRIYAPEKCCIVPNRVNCLFEKAKSHRGDTAIGTSYDKKYGVYRAKCRGYDSKIVHLGSYVTEEDAFNAYKKFKESLIKRIAKEEYANGNITQKCYEAMMNYIVEKDD